MGPESSCCLHILYQLSAVFRVIIKHFHFETDPGYCTVHVAEINDKKRKNGGRDEEIPLMRFKLSMFATFHRCAAKLQEKRKNDIFPQKTGNVKSGSKMQMCKGSRRFNIWKPSRPVQCRQRHPTMPRQKVWLKKYDYENTSRVREPGYGISVASVQTSHRITYLLCFWRLALRSFAGT